MNNMSRQEYERVQESIETVNAAIDAVSAAREKMLDLYADGKLIAEDFETINATEARLRILRDMYNESIAWNFSILKFVDLVNIWKKGDKDD